MQATPGRWVAVVGALAALIAALTLPPEAAAYQFNSTIRGKVVDEGDKPLAGVKITITKMAQDPSRPTEPVELVTREAADAAEIRDFIALLKEMIGG